MEFLRKSVKVYAAALILFVLLTLALAAVLRYTAFSAGWSFAGLLVIMSVVAAFTGLLEGRLTGKKGMLTGAAAAAVFVLVIILAAGGIFAGSFGMESFSVVYLIPVAAGAVGGVFGAIMGRSREISGFTDNRRAFATDGAKQKMALHCKTVRAKTVERGHIIMRQLPLFSRCQPEKPASISNNVFWGLYIPGSYFLRPQ